MSKTIKPIHAYQGEVVRIIWHHPKRNDRLTQELTAPSEDVWTSTYGPLKEMPDAARND